MSTPTFDPDALLLALCEHGVAFAVIGGWAAKEAGGETYQTLVADAVPTTVGDVHELRIASLAAIARMKRAANRPNDRQALPRIEEALRQRERDTDE